MFDAIDGIEFVSIHAIRDRLVAGCRRRRVGSDAEWIHSFKNGGWHGRGWHGPIAAESRWARSRFPEWMWRLPARVLESDPWLGAYQIVELGKRQLGLVGTRRNGQRMKTLSGRQARDDKKQSHGQTKLDWKERPHAIVPGRKVGALLTTEAECQNYSVSFS